MSNPKIAVKAGPLSGPCEAVLAAHELCSSEIRPNGLVDVLTSEGDRCFAITPTISPVDLRTLIVHGRMSRLMGEESGRRGLAASLRNLLGAAAAA